MNLAPIVLFAYNRPWHTSQTLASLAENDLAKESILFIYADGPKETASAEDLKKINETRKVIRLQQWCKEVHVIESEKNMGLADSIIQGVTHIVNKYDKIIVLEDDLVLSKGFLRYMNDALNLYENEEKVLHISGYMFPVKVKLPETFFYNATSCWGWATWKRAWKHFNPDAGELYLELLENNNLNKFDFKESFGFLNQLKANKDGKLKTWAIKWHTSVFLKEGLCLHPNRSLVNNIGHDGTGDNCGNSLKYDVPFLAEHISIKPEKLKESVIARDAIVVFNSPKNFQGPTITWHIKNKICQFVPNIIKNKLKRVLK